MRDTTRKLLKLAAPVDDKYAEGEDIRLLAPMSQPGRVNIRLPDKSNGCTSARMEHDSRSKHDINYSPEKYHEMMDISCAFSPLTFFGLVVRLNVLEAQGATTSVFL